MTLLELIDNYKPLLLHLVVIVGNLSRWPERDTLRKIATRKLIAKSPTTSPREYHKKYGAKRDIPAQPHAFSSAALNLRTLSRLPKALLETRDFARLRGTLGDLKFVQAECMAGMGYELLAEATKAVSFAVDGKAETEVNLKISLRQWYPQKAVASIKVKY